MQIELGVTATDFEYVLPGDQLARCQRYYRTSESLNGSIRAVTTNVVFASPDATDMRAAPVHTVIITASGVIHDSTASVNRALTTTINTAGPRLELVLTAGGTAGNQVQLQNGAISLSAEL